MLTAVSDCDSTIILLYNIYQAGRPHVGEPLLRGSNSPSHLFASLLIKIAKTS